MKYLLGIILLFFGAIPWIQHYYWKKNQFSIWKWGGMAMFTRPKRVRFTVEVPGYKFPESMTYDLLKLQDMMFLWGYAASLNSIAEKMASHYKIDKLKIKITRSQLSLKENKISKIVTYRDFNCKNTCELIK